MYRDVRLLAVFLFVPAKGSTFIFPSGTEQLIKEALQNKPWGEFGTIAPPSNAHISDVYVFMCWAWCHTGHFAVWDKLFQHASPSLVLVAGSIIELCGMNLAELPPTAIPPLHNATGNRRRYSDPVNKFVLLQKMEGQTLTCPQIFTCFWL